MLALALSLPALALTLGSAEPPMPVLHGHGAAPDAWVAISEGHLWVCWDGHASNRSPPPAGCWQRVALELATPATDALAELDEDADAASEIARPPSGVDVGAESLRVGFSDPGTLWVISGAAAWLVDRNGLATALADPPLDLELDPLTPQLCESEGWLPRRSQGVWSWRPAPCDEAAPCRQLPRLRRVRRATGARIDLALELSLVRRRELDEGRASALHGAALVSLAIGLDRRGAQRERQLLARWRRISLPGGLPPPRAYGALAGAERAALRRAQCRAWEGVR